MERKYVMQLPRGAKVSSTDIKCEDGKIVLTAQLEEWKPKDGEICYVRDISGYRAIFIKRDDGYNTTSFYVSLDFYDNNKILNVNPDFVTHDLEIDVLRPATDKEKKEFFDALAEQNKRWNAEKKVVEDVRWRAKVGEAYYNIEGLKYLEVFVRSKTEEHSPVCDMHYEAGNYFKTEEAARTAGEQMLELLKNSKAE